MENQRGGRSTRRGDNVKKDHTSELYHYGVPGMKWGVRRAIRRSARADRRISKINMDRSINKDARKAADRDANYRFKGNEKN